MPAKARPHAYPQQEAMDLLVLNVAAHRDRLKFLYLEGPPRAAAAGRGCRPWAADGGPKHKLVCVGIEGQPRYCVVTRASSHNHTRLSEEVAAPRVAGKGI